MHNHAIFVHKNYIKIAHFSKFEQLKMARREGEDCPAFLIESAIVHAYFYACSRLRG